MVKKKKKPTKLRKKIHIPATPKKAEVQKEDPRVFLDRNRHVFLLTRQEGNFNYYVTMADGISVDEVKLGAESDTVRGLIPYTYDLEKAAQKLNDCFMTKTWSATVALCKLLGKPVPEIPEEVKEKRRAAGERLKTARQKVVHGYTLAHLCDHLEADPPVVRKLLRKFKIQKPSGGWYWESEKEAFDVAKQIGIMKDKPSKRSKK